jgi:hypothetical protein
MNAIPRVRRGIDRLGGSFGFGLKALDPDRENPNGV